MTHLAANLKRLRAVRKCSCDIAAHGIGIKRSSLSGYEQGTAEPTLANLCAISDFYRITLDTLVRTNLTIMTGFAIGQLQRSFKPQPATTA